MEAADVGSESWVASLLLFMGTPTALIFAIIAGYFLARHLSRPPTTTTEENMVRVRRPSARNDCPICIDPARFAVETNCGHIFCANCLIQNWRYNPATSPMACPFCRQEVTLMLPCFTERETNTAELPEIQERERLLKDVQQYNRMYSDHPRSLYGQLQDLPTILRHMWAELFTWRGVEVMSRFRVIVCLVTGIMYAIMPVDLIPEAFLGLLGLIDDVIVIAFLLIQNNLTTAGWEEERSPGLGRCIADHFAFSEEQLTRTPTLECGSESCSLTVEPQRLLRLLTESGWNVVSFSHERENKIWIMYKKEKENSRDSNHASNTGDVVISNKTKRNDNDDIRH